MSKLFIDSISKEERETDGFIMALYRQVRNARKKLDTIKDLNKRAKKGEALTEEQEVKRASYEETLDLVKRLDETLKLYKETKTPSAGSGSATQTDSVRSETISALVSFVLVAQQNPEVFPAYGRLLVRNSEKALQAQIDEASKELGKLLAKEKTQKMIEEQLEADAEARKPKAEDKPEEVGVIGQPKQEEETVEENKPEQTEETQ